MIRSNPGHRRWLGTIVAAGIVAAVAMVSAASVSAASGSASHMSVDPIVSPAGAFDPAYGLFTCQVDNLSPATTCYDPFQMRTAYGIAPLIANGSDGKGKTIVIVDAFQSPNIVQQLNTYDSFYGLPSLNGLGGAPNPSLGTFTQVAPDGLTPFVVGDPDMTGWAEEISLDVLWAHAIAPGANIVLDLAKSDQDPDIVSAVQYAVDHNLGDVISQSFGENEACIDPALTAAYHSTYAAATMKGMTIFASSGDNGAAQPTCDGSALVQAVSSPASDPLVTSVGGTELHAARYCLAIAPPCSTTPAPGTYEGELAWNEAATGFGASGGGFSTVWSEPSYQQGTIHGGKQRAVPDVSYSAAVHHGALTYLNIPGIPAGFYLFGGTSAGSPQWAAITAIADEIAGHDLGFINTALYHIGQAPPHYAAGFNDVTSGNNAIGTIAGFNAGTGWDPVTGLGSPIANQLIPMLIQFDSPGDGVAAINGSKHG